MERLFGQEEPVPGATSAAAPGAPLATRLRPHTLDEFVGQDRLLAAGSSLRTAIEWFVANGYAPAFENRPA